jgi:hypothetical protein
METLFKFKKNTKAHVGSYFYCSEGDKYWQWHKIISIDRKTNKIGFVWLTASYKIADPLVIDLKNWEKEAITGEWKITDSDPRIPYDLKMAWSVENKI